MVDDMEEEQGSFMPDDGPEVCRRLCSVPCPCLCPISTPNGQLLNISSAHCHQLISPARHPCLHSAVGVTLSTWTGPWTMGWKCRL